MAKRRNSLGIVVALLFLSATDILAAGAKPTDPAQPKPIPTLQAEPYRYVNLAHVTVPAFYLPNGTKADFNSDLNSILATAINSSRYIRTQEDTASNKSRLVITGGVTNLELNVLQMNLKIGWNQGGALPIGDFDSSHAEVDLQLSALSMDFKIYDRYTGKVYSASYTNETLSHLHMTVHVNLSDITANLDLLYKTSLADTIRKATLDIMTNMENKQNFSLIPWEAKILGVDHNQNNAVFNIGMSDGVRVNEIYSIYSGCTKQEKNTPNACFERFLADVRVSNTSPGSTQVIPFTTNDNLSQVQTGDTVYVKTLVSTDRNLLP